MKALQKTVALALMLGIFSIPAAMASTANGNGEDQPHMQAALEALKQARQHLQEAAHDKGGHRAAALKAVDDAIKHTEMGIKAGDKNEHDHDHDHDHDKK
jgi:hypothetical protein